MAVKTYDPKDIIIIFGPLLINSGFADGTFVSVNRANPMWTRQIGSDGEGARSKSNDKSGDIAFTLMQTSSQNQGLSTLAQLDELGNAGAFPLMIKDANGNTLYTAETAWVTKFADSEYAREAGNRTWELQTDILVVNIAGN